MLLFGAKIADFRAIMARNAQGFSAWVLIGQNGSVVKADTPIHLEL
jgi:hypothetical protein